MGCCESETDFPQHKNKDFRPIRMNPKMHATPRDADGKELPAWEEVKVPNQVFLKALHEHKLEYIEDIGAV